MSPPILGDFGVGTVLPLPLAGCCTFWLYCLIFSKASDSAVAANASSSSAYCLSSYSMLPATGAVPVLVITASKSWVALVRLLAVLYFADAANISSSLAL